MVNVGDRLGDSTGVLEGTLEGEAVGDFEGKAVGTVGDDVGAFNEVQKHKREVETEHAGIIVPEYQVIAAVDVQLP